MDRENSVGWRFKEIRDTPPRLGQISLGAVGFTPVYLPSPILKNTGEYKYGRVISVVPLKIDPEFEGLCPKLRDDEYEKLETSIDQEGCRDPLVIWAGIILDGHNRYEICTRLGKGYDTVPAPGWVKTRQDAEDWIIDNQLGRRNLTVEQRMYLIGKKYKGQKKQGERTDLTSDHNDQKLTTARKIAEEEKVSEPTVRRAEKFTDAIDLLTETIGKKSTDKILSREVNISQKDVKRLAEKDPEEQIELIGKVVSGEAKSVVDARRILHKERVKDVTLEPGDNRYRVIYADPPWQYSDTRDGYTTGAEDHYPTMTIPELCDLPVRDLAMDNAVLFFWTTSPMLEDSFKVINAWGFKYKSSFVWDKVRHNMGHYNSVRHELLLVCTRGSCLPDSDKLIDSVQEIERTEKHSEKPEEFREIIDTMYTHGEKICLFARREVEGWEIWGNEV